MIAEPGAFRPSGRVAIFQPRPGLGDLIWHLPLIRAIAAASQDGCVTLVTKPSTQAATLLRNDPAIARIVAFDRNPREGVGRHDGVPGFVRLVADLGGCRAESCVLLHHGASLAAAMRLAGIKARYGYGTTRAQRAWLNRAPFISKPAPFTEAFEQAAAWARAAGLTGLHEPRVAVDPVARARLHARLKGIERPWAVLGVGAHGADRRWGAGPFARLADTLARSFNAVLLLAGANEAGLVTDIRGVATEPAKLRQAVGWPLEEVVALLAEAELFVGTDSGPANLRAAVGRPAYTLFGASGPLLHSVYLRAIIAPAGPRAGMAAITVEQVLASIRLSPDAPT